MKWTKQTIMKYCRNKRINQEIRELQISVDYWKVFLKANSLVTREHAAKVIMYKGNAIRRMEKLKNK